MTLRHYTNLFILLLPSIIIIAKCFAFDTSNTIKTPPPSHVVYAHWTLYRDTTANNNALQWVNSDLQAFLAHENQLQVV